MVQKNRQKMEIKDNPDAGIDRRAYLMRRDFKSALSSVACISNLLERVSEISVLES